MAISRFELRAIEWIWEIMNNGYYQKNERTGIGTKRIPHMIMGIDCANDVPLIKAKKTLWKSSVEEMFWIFRDGDNNIHNLRPHIWDEWADENGIVQKTYGYQIKKFDQVNRILNDLARDPSTRRAVIDLWNNADLPEMAITPCVYTSVWDVVDGKLNALVTSRSCDLLLGGFFNMFQYTIMNKLFARHLGVEPGLLTFVAADAHIYENQFEGCNKMLQQYQVLLAIGMIVDGRIPEKGPLTNMEFFEIVSREANKDIGENPDYASAVNKARFQTCEKIINEILETDEDFDFVGVYYSEPSIRIENADGSDNTDFFKTVIDDIHVDNYKSMPHIKLPVAV